MPTFQKTELVDARQFTGGAQNGSDLAFWVNSNQGEAMWFEKTDQVSEMLRVYTKGGPIYFAFVSDWVILHQDGSFSAMRSEIFESKYKQV